MLSKTLKFEFILIFVLIIDNVTLIKISDEVNSICGIRKKHPEMKIRSRISGGTECFHGNYPWLSAIMENAPKNQDKKFLCGGSLISELHVLTAAHCIHKKGGNRKSSEHIEVILGAHNLSVPHESDRIMKKVKNIEIHNDYNSTSLERFTGDIALITLYDKVTFTDYILPICIFDHQKLQFSDFKELKSGFLTGWGNTLSSPNKHSDVPNEVFVPIVDDASCYRHDHRLAKSAWDKSFCAGSEGKSACPGDSGSGFYVKKGNRFYLRGLVSSSINGGGCSNEDNHLVIFSDVFKYNLLAFRDTFHEQSSFRNVAVDESDETYGGIFDPAVHRQQTTRPVLPYEYMHKDDGQNNFDWDLTKAVLFKDESRNKCFSPLAVQSLLAIVAEAAGQDVKSGTRTQLENALPFNRSLPAAREYFGRVLRSIKDGKSPYYTVNFESRVYGDKDVKMNQKFIALVEYNYKAGVENLNFNDSHNAAEKINDWISFKTEERIQNIVTEDSVSNSAILLINGVSFNAKWTYGFDKQSTRSHEFTLSPGKKVYKECMHMTRILYYRYSCKLNSRIIRLPYEGNKFSMFVILPFETDGIDKVLTLLSGKELRDEIQYLKETNVRLTLPKFQMEVFNNLKEVIKGVGITEIFENYAVLPLLARGWLSEGKLKISNIIQKTLIKVDEGGPVTLSAEDEQKYTRCIGDTVDFNADHPFLFYIEDETTSAILLTGRVDDPQFQNEENTKKK